MSTVSRAGQRPGPRVAHRRRSLKSGSIREFQRSVAFGDLTIIAVAVVVTHLSKFGFTDPTVGGSPDVSYVPLSILLGLVWWGMLLANHTYRRRLLGSGVEEYQRVFQSTFMVFGAVAIFSYLLRIQVARSYFLLALPIGLFGILLWRWLARKELIRRRSRNELCDRVVILGGHRTASDLAKEFARHPDLGLNVLGACVPGREVDTLQGTAVPVLGDVTDVEQVLQCTGADTLVITSSPSLSARKIRELGWRLDPGRIHVVIAPSIIDVAGPRMHLRPVDGLSLVELEMPRFDGSKLLFKRALDLTVVLLASILVVPVGLVVALAIKIDDGGPVFFRQKRVGRDDADFTMWKFRSMRTDAEQVLVELRRNQAAQNAGNEILFKMKDDPRVTRVGRVLRKLSLDELPQLINVLIGDMSLVGPRPPLRREVESYEDRVRRKFLVKPGLTGLWQVSGRSELSWEDSVRLDLYYVENWSLTGDLQILFRTFKVVLARDGAY